MTQQESGLRDLSRKLADVARDHPNYSQAAPAVSMLIDHLCALARIEELNAQLMQSRPASPYTDWRVKEVDLIT
jgi:hypothetical protein